MIHGNAAFVIQVLTLIVAAERGAVYLVKLYKNNKAK